MNTLRNREEGVYTSYTPALRVHYHFNLQLR